MGSCQAARSLRLSRRKCLRECWKGMVRLKNFLSFEGRVWHEKKGHLRSFDATHTSGAISMYLGVEMASQVTDNGCIWILVSFGSLT